MHSDKFHPSIRKAAITAALDHLNSNRGRGDVGNWTLTGGGQGTAERRYRHRRPDTFRFRVQFKESPARVTVSALESTRTEKFKPVA